MRVISIGLQPSLQEMVQVALHLRWPDADLLESDLAQPGLEMVEMESPDLVMLQTTANSDLSLTETIKELRRFSAVPLMVWEHEGGEMEVVKALELGADDYIRSSCGFTELVAHMVALMRRFRTMPDKEDAPVITSGDLMINPTTHEVYLANARLDLTPTELRLLYILVKNRSVVVSHRYLEGLLWEDGTERGPSLKKYIQRLRRKLDDDSRNPRWVATIRGVGYRFIGPSAEPQPTERYMAAAR